MTASLVPEANRDSRGARVALGLLVTVHGVLLLLMLRDYFADNDLGFHISLARQHAERGSCWWDHLNWAPTARPNVFPDTDLLFDEEAMRNWRGELAAQKARAGRIQLAVLLYAHAIEDTHPEIASGVRGSVTGWGSVANFIGDETALDYVDEEGFRRFLENLRGFAVQAQVMRRQTLPTPELDEATDRLFHEFF